MKYMRYLRLERIDTQSLMTYRLPELFPRPDDELSDVSWARELDQLVDEILPGWYWLAADEENVYDEAPNEPDVIFPLEDY
jgi:hypothetical protein